MVGDFNYDPRRRGAETEVDREVRKFVEEMRLQDVSYSGAPGPSHYLAPEGSAPSRIDAVYADPSWVKRVTAGYMVGPEEMQDRKGHCPMMVTVDVKVIRSCTTCWAFSSRSMGTASSTYACAGDVCGALASCGYSRAIQLTRGSMASKCRNGPSTPPCSTPLPGVTHSVQGHGEIHGRPCRGTLRASAC